MNKATKLPCTAVILVDSMPANMGAVSLPPVSAGYSVSLYDKSVEITQLQQNFKMVKIYGTDALTRAY